MDLDSIGNILLSVTRLPKGYYINISVKNLLRCVNGKRYTFMGDSFVKIVSASEKGSTLEGKYKILEQNNDNLTDTKPSLKR